MHVLILALAFSMPCENGVCRVPVKAVIAAPAKATVHVFEAQPVRKLFKARPLRRLFARFRR